MKRLYSSAALRFYVRLALTAELLYYVGVGKRWALVVALALLTLAIEALSFLLSRLVDQVRELVADVAKERDFRLRAAGKIDWPARTYAYPVGHSIAGVYESGLLCSIHGFTKNASECPACVAAANEETTS